MNHICLKSVSLAYEKAGKTGFFKRNGPGPGKPLKALDDITVRIEEGDKVALMGKNGAGKSTLLRVMAGIYPPTSGKISRRGEVFTFFGKSIGVNQQLSGLDNIFLRGYFLGYRKDRIEKDFLPKIREAADLGDRLHLPVMTYSSGMKTRLSFGLHLFARGDIFLIDEALAAGDASFIKRARKITEKILSRSNIIVFASHSTHLLKKFCNRGIVLDQGRLVYFGSVEKALQAYLGRIS